MFRIDVLPAQRGDCLWLTYGTPDDLHHVLVDAGPQETIKTLVPVLEDRIRALPGRTSRVELLVVTHVDADHIQGVVSLLSGPGRVKLFRDVWFNGFEHLDAPMLGGVDAEELTLSLLQEPGRWNKAFDGEAVVLPDTGDLPVRTLRGGLRLTLLGPTHAALTKLAPEWVEACRRAGIVPGQGAPVRRRSSVRDEFLGFNPDLLAQAKFIADRSAPNGASITLVAEYDGKRVLLLGDAITPEVTAGLDRLGPGPHRFDAVKLSHHGSRRNTSLDLLGRITSKKWLVSSNGATFGHPDPECLARVVVTQRKPTFYLNYVTDRVTDLIAGAGERYSVKLPRATRDGGHEEGISVTV